MPLIARSNSRGCRPTEKYLGSNLLWARRRKCLSYSTADLARARTNNKAYRPVGISRINLGTPFPLEWQHRTSYRATFSCRGGGSRVKREQPERSLAFPIFACYRRSKSIKPTTGATQVDDCFGKNRHCMSRISDTQMLRGKSNDSLCNKEKKTKKQMRNRIKMLYKKILKLFLISLDINLI